MASSTNITGKGPGHYLPAEKSPRVQVGARKRQKRTVGGVLGYTVKYRPEELHKGCSKPRDDPSGGMRGTTL